MAARGLCNSDNGSMSLMCFPFNVTRFGADDKIKREDPGSSTFMFIKIHSEILYKLGQIQLQELRVSIRVSKKPGHYYH